MTIERQRPPVPAPTPVPVPRPREFFPPHAPSARASRTAASSRPSAHRVVRVAVFPREVRAPSPIRETTAQRLVADERTIAKALTQLRAQNDPIATQARSAVTVTTKSYGGLASGGSPGEGYLYPIRSWHADGYTYYYLRYRVTYPDGTHEEGVVPWPVRYVAQGDPFVHGRPPYRLPLPLPLADFVPDDPAAFPPLIAYCYRHRSEVASCPIAHE